MRRSFPFACLTFSLFFSLVLTGGTALAQKKPKAKEPPKEAGPSAAATWTDPTESEKSDKGPYAPRKVEPDEAQPAHESARRPDRGRKRDKLDAFGQIVIGFGRAPQNSPSYEPGDKGTAIGFQVGGRYDATRELSVGLRIPLTTATVKTGGRNQSSTVFGSPELFAEYRLSLGRLTTVPLLFGVGIPVAGGSADQGITTDRAGFASAYVNRLADATTGFRDSELFQPKHLPIVLGGGIRHEREDWELHADLKLVFLPALSSTVANPNSPPPYFGTYKINKLALREVTTLGGSYNFLASPLIYAGLDLAFVWTPIETFVFDAEGDSDARPTSVQAVLEPRVGARFGKVSPSVGYIAPLGGRLGDGDVGGIRLRVDALF
jgi:hypothetical protein